MKMFQLFDNLIMKFNKLVNTIYTQMTHNC